MRRLFSLCLCLFLVGCHSDAFIQSEISRSQVYYGQPIGDLYDNFGAPKRAERFPYDVIVYTFSQEEIVAGRVDKAFKYCDLRVYVQNDRVIDWDWNGNNCQFKEKDTQMTLFDDFYDDFNNGEHEES